MSKLLTCELHYDYIRNKYDNKSKLFPDTDHLMCEFKTENVNEDFSSDKKMCDFNYDSTKSKYYDVSNKLLIGKMKDETGAIAIAEFVGLKLKKYSFLAYNSEHKKNQKL